MHYQLRQPIQCIKCFPGSQKVRRQRESRPKRQGQAIQIHRRATEAFYREWVYPVVSVDAKKKELVGNFKNAGATYRRKPANVNVYDFPSDAKGKVTPYGVYDIVANTGAVFVGTSFDTPSFAVESVARWWKLTGTEKYSSKSRKL
ncbi:MAG: hypothetical protein V2B19_17115 [Pseudomonadota bacterium]